MKRRPQWADVWWIDLGRGKPRPALVLSRPEAVERLERLLVVPASTVVRGLVSEVHLDESDGLPQPCVLQLDTPEMVERRDIGDFITQLRASRWDEVCAAMSAAINC